MSEPAVIMEDIVHRFGAFVALNDVSLTVEAGEFVVLLGPSGSGKTTLLSILGGFLTPNEGTVTINGQDMTRVPPARRPTITVFQDYALFPHMTIDENIAFGLIMHKVGKAERTKRIAEVLDLVGLPDAGPKKPHELSGGQRQRVALARSLAVEPSVLLLDEPLGALDLKLRRQMQEELKDIQQRVGTTFIHVTHDQEEAMAIADQIVVMNEGRIEDKGTPERVYLNPYSLFAASFMGETNFIVGAVEALKGRTLSIATEVGELQVPVDDEVCDLFPVGTSVVLSIRPEHLMTTRRRKNFLDLGQVRVDSIGFVGTHHQCRTSHKSAAGVMPLIHLPQSEQTEIGTELSLYADPADVVVLLAEE